MKELPLVSVNMAAYNAAPFIAEAIQSVLSQTYHNWELIIVNDCSTDNTADVIAKFSDPRIKVFQNEQNESIVYTRNKALHYSQGKYIAVLDADDVFLPTKLQIQVEFLEDNSEFIMVGTGFRFIDETGKQLPGHTKLFARAEYFPTILLFNNFFVHSSVMYHTELAKSILYKPLVKGYSPAEEYQLYVQFAKTHKMFNLPAELALYRQHPSGISKIREDKINEHVDLVIAAQLRDLKIFPTHEELVLHKNIHFAFDNLEWNLIGKIKNWLQKLISQNKRTNRFDDFFFEYLALKWYEIARLNANFGLKMIFMFYSSPLAFHKTITWQKRKDLILRCLYEFKSKYTTRNA